MNKNFVRPTVLSWEIWEYRVSPWQCLLADNVQWSTNILCHGRGCETVPIVSCGVVICRFAEVETPAVQIQLIESEQVVNERYAQYKR